MQYDVENSKEYIEALTDDWRKSRLLEIRQIILSSSPLIEESIQYKMLAFGTRDNILFHLNAQSAYVSLYVSDINKIDEGGHYLGGLSLGKGCIRFRKSDEIAGSQIDLFIKKAVDYWIQKKDLSC
jgi:uncharacterized protein YdhG (YjbR/CyaY superfamily)